MSRLLIKGAEAALPTGSGSASTFDNATVVRLVNTATGADHLVTVVETQGGTTCLLYTSPSPRDATLSRMPSSA